MEEVVEKDLNTVHKKPKERIGGLRKKTDLSDIILEKEKNTNVRNRKIILGAAYLILLFLLFLIISKVVYSKDNAKENVAKKSVQEKSMATKIVAKDNTNEDETLNETDSKFDEMVRKLKEEDLKEDTQIQLTQDNTPSEEDISNEIAKATIPNLAKKAEQKVTSTTSANLMPKEQKIKEIKKIKKAEPKKIIKITEVKPKRVHKKTKTSRRTPYFAKRSGYYIQVGATTSPTPNRALVSRIRQYGYHYIVYPTVIKGRKFYKLLIGPFPSKTRALDKLFDIKATIAPGAFIYFLR